MRPVLPAVGSARPVRGPNYGDDGAGLNNDFANRNTTFMSWNLMHIAWMLRSARGVPADGNQRSEWDAGERFDLQNREHG